MTSETNNDIAKEQFIKRMNHSDMYFIEGEIPKNESDKNAHVVCGDVEGAKKYCPTRWRALQNWFDEAHMVSEETKLLRCLSFSVLFKFCVVRRPGMPRLNRASSLMGKVNQLLHIAFQRLLATFIGNVRGFLLMQSEFRQFYLNYLFRVHYAFGQSSWPEACI